MRKYIMGCMALILAAGSARAAIFSDDAQPCQALPAGASFETGFSGTGTTQPAVLHEIASAQKSIRLVSRHFASKALGEALIAAMRGGKDVKIILDAKENSTGYSSATLLANLSLFPHVTPHDVYETYAIIDDKDVILGNIGRVPDDSDEKAGAGNIVIIHNAPDLARQYLADWQALWASSKEMPKK